MFTRIWLIFEPKCECQVDRRGSCWNPGWRNSFERNRVSSQICLIVFQTTDEASRVHVYTHLADFWAEIWMWSWSRSHMRVAHISTHLVECYKLTLTERKYTSFEHLAGISLDFTISQRNTSWFFSFGWTIFSVRLTCFSLVRQESHEGMNEKLKE